ncbi:MAG: TonB-dependent receptor [Flavobacterium sp.]|nr:TonB-dependent receptor [Flavobacterium sp.]
MFFAVYLVSSQVKKDTISLSEIKIVTSPIKTSLQNAAYSVSVIDRKELNTTDGVILTAVLNKISGVFMLQGTLNTNRITIRGIGARAQYGTTRLKTYFENIPLTSAEGESSIEDVDLESIGSIEIIKGPNSTSFGSGLGGVIHLLATEASFQQLEGKSTTTYGSFGFVKQTLSGAFATTNSNVYTSYSHLQSDGFRQNSAYDRKSFNFHGKQKIKQNGSLSFIGIFTRLKAFIPSSINETDYENHPEKAAFTWAASQGYESYDKLLVGIGYSYKLSDKWNFVSSIFSNYKKAYEARPFDILDEKTSTIGLRSVLNYKSTLLSIPFEGSLGTELATEKYGVSLFKNGYLSQPNQGSIAGAEFSKMKQNRKYSNYFLQMDFSLTKALHLETGLAFNTTQYTLQDVFEPNSNNPKQSYSFGSVWSPRAGLSYQIAKAKNFYTSISKGFSTPAVAETLTPTGQINTKLKPEIGWNYELGFKGNWLNHKLYTEIALYSCQITNLLVANRTANDQYIGINAGESSHIGLEYLLNYQLVKTEQWQLSATISGTVNHFKFKDFVDVGKDYSGNELTGAPASQSNFGLNASTKSGFSLYTSFRKVGKIPMNDQNSKYTQAYSLLDVKTSYAFTILKRLKTELNAGINNVSNTHYAASILPNAVGFGNVQPRYYYPGNPRNYFGGINLSYLF